MPKEDPEEDEAGERGGTILLEGRCDGVLLLLLLSRNMRVLDLERRASVLLKGGGASGSNSQIGRVGRPW